MGTNLGGVVQDAIPDDRRLQVLRRRWSPRALLALPAHSVAMKNPRFCGGPGIQYYEEHRIGKYAPTDSSYIRTASRNCTKPGSARPANHHHVPV